MAINDTLKQLPLELSFSPLPSKRFQWMVNLQHSFKMNEEMLAMSEKESEDLRGKRRPCVQQIAPVVRAEPSP